LKVAKHKNQKSKIKNNDILMLQIESELKNIIANIPSKFRITILQKIKY